MHSERREGPTPNGGAYSIALYSRDGEPVDKEQATAVEITEYTDDDEVLMRTYASIAPHD